MRDTLSTVDQENQYWQI